MAPALQISTLVDFGWAMKSDPPKGGRFHDPIFAFLPVRWGIKEELLFEFEAQQNARQARVKQ